MPIGQALSIVSDSVPQRTLRHVLLHLDISGTEGGELVPALRNLSEYVHNEWKLSVETRVKRLENLVVFPVFASVMGLLVLTSAVPLVPILEFMDTLSAKQPQAVSALNPVGTGRSK
jgi:type II secretory pathway component PulF